ncbi:AraC-like DNA-binding protein [Sphingobium sp. OAS761]|nr:AraC-like DNA-binding protein [Sphingobium sp. OAS761]
MQAALVDAIETFLDMRGGGQGHFETAMSGVHVMRAFQEIPPIRRIYSPSLCIVLKGAKEIVFGETTLHYAEMECLVVSIEMPASGRMIGATPETPFLGITVELDVSLLREVMQQLSSQPQRDGASDACVFVGQVDGPLADCVLRLANLAQTPEAAQILFPAVMREICYWLLTGSHGGEVAKLALPDTQTVRVANAIYYLRDHFAQTVRMSGLADIAGMSLSSFHQHFRRMTDMTPVQYQKQLRLLEARRLMVSNGASVSEAAYEVGYESPSQFSREYTRAFGTAPKRDAMNFRALVEAGTR